MMNTMIFIEVYLLAGKLLLVVAIHSLGGSRANWHHTPNPQWVPHNQHKIRITQATSNPLEYLLTFRRGKIKNPSQSPRPETITNLHSTILVALSHLGGGNHQE